MIGTLVIGGFASALVVFGASIGTAIQGHIGLTEIAFTVIWDVIRWVGSPAGWNELTPGPALVILKGLLPGQGPGRHTERRPVAACTKSISATCILKHPSADRY